MFFYFTANQPAIIKIDGVYHGSIKEKKAFTLDLSSSPLIEVCPIGTLSLPFTFFLNNDFLSSPPPLASVTDLCGGYFVKINLPCPKSEFRIIAQKKFEFCLATVFNENGIKICIESQSNFYSESVISEYETVTIQDFCLDNKQFIAVIFERNIKHAFIYHICDNITKVFEREVDQISFHNGFNTIENLLDIAKHKIQTEWLFKNGNFESKNLSVTHSANFAPELLPKEIAPYAFLEEVIVGGDYTVYLSDNMKRNADKLKGFLGEFIGITPPPTFKDQTTVGLIYKRRENLCNVKYLHFTFVNGKIDNVFFDD